MKIDIVKNYISKIVATMFCLVMLIYSQCSYAGIGDIYTDERGHVWLMMSSDDQTIEITSQMAIEIEQILKDKQVYGLVIHYLPFATDAVEWLTNFLRTPIVNLELRGNNSERGIHAIAEGLRTSPTLTELHLNFGYIDANRVEILAPVLESNTTLTGLYLYCNNICAASVKALAEALKRNAALIVLSLERNMIGDIGAQALGETLRINRVLKSLNLAANRIGDAGAQALADSLRANLTLATLYLQENDIGDAGGVAIANMLRTNTALTVLNIGVNDIGREGRRVIIMALVDNVTLQEVYMDCEETEQNIVDLILKRNKLIRSLLHGVPSGIDEIHQLQIRILNLLGMPVPIRPQLHEMDIARDFVHALGDINHGFVFPASLLF